MTYQVTDQEAGTRSNYLCLPDLLSVTVNDHDYMVKQLDKCKCCLRHQANRPPDILHSNLGTKKAYPYHMHLIVNVCVDTSQDNLSRLSGVLLKKRYGLGMNIRGAGLD